MKFKKVAAVGFSVIALTNTALPTITVFADEAKNRTVLELVVEDHTSIMQKFELETRQNFLEYKDQFKIATELIESVASNGGKYGSSTPEKAVDDNTSTHWETGKPNTSDFNNEFTIVFKESVSIDKMTYKVRQDSGTKGFLKSYEIYGSLSDEGEDFTLITKGTGTPTKDTMEIRFNETEVKRVKIKFVDVDREWASISELGFYKKDIVNDAMENLFTDSSKNQVTEEYRSLDKLGVLEDLAKKHPFYNDYIEAIEDAKAILENTEIIATEAKTKKFTLYNNEEYNNLFKMDNSNIESIKNNAGHYSSRVIENAIDGDVDTYWETNKSNTSDWNNEVEIKFKDKVVLDRIVYGARQNDTKGFAEEFEIYASNTSYGDTYQLVATGNQSRVSGLVEAKFDPTEFKRIKFVFKKSNQNWATLNEIAFYTEDELSNKVDRLFTDDTLSIVSEEFNTIEKIESLEEEVKSHPLYSTFKEDIENAKAIVANGKIEASNATVSTFELLENEAYSKLFKIDRSSIKSIKNNAGHYSSRVIENAIDGDLETYWETNKANTSDWNNEVEIEFNEIVELNRVVYGARPNDAKGFAEEFEIYASTTTKGDTYELVATGVYNTTKNLIEAKFEPTEFRRIKFKFKKSNQNWATAREFIFYTEDKLTDDIKNMFTDNTYSDLKEEFKSIDKLNQLREEAMLHPLKEELIEYVDMAQEILSGEVDYSKTIIVADQHGDMSSHAKNTLQMNSFGQNLQATGLYALPGDKITVYLEVDATKGKMPVLMFSQNEGSWSAWAKSITLKPGKNEIIVPGLDLNNGKYPTNPKAGGAIYIRNAYTPEEQGKEPVIRIEGAERFPFFKEGDNEEEFKSFLVEYKQKLDEDNQTGANKILDILAVESDRMLISGTATGAYDAYITKGNNPSETTTFWDETMEEIFRFYGLDGSSEEHDPKYLKEHIMFAQPFGYMYAWYDHIGVQKDVMSKMLIPDAVKAESWGFIHETGHRMDTRNRIWGEVTNNMLAIQIAHFHGAKPGHTPPYETIYKKAAPSVREELYVNGNYFESLGMFWQLQLFNDSYWANVNKLYRERKPSVEDGQQKIDIFIEYSSEVLNRDLSEYFYRHGFRASEETKAKLANKYDSLEKKVWYLNDTVYNYDGQGISKESKPTIESVDKDGNIKITSEIDAKDLLGYEIIKNGEVIGFTASDTYKDENRDMTVENNYEVVAYGKDLSVSATSNKYDAKTPIISLQQSKVYVGLHSQFDPLSYIKAATYQDEDISENIEVSHNVDTTKRGNYSVTYTVKDEGIIVKKEIDVEVVSGIDYLSDEAWTSVETQYGTPRRNSNIKGRVSGEIREFEKGIGIHANGKVEYNLEGTNYDNFQALLGVDMIIASQSRSSIKFKVLGDGEVLAETNVLKHADNMVSIDVPIKGVKTLTIEISDAGNGNASDHGIIVNPTLTTNNRKPELEIEKSVTVKVGEKLENVIGNIKATDIEDGDLSGNVKVTGHEDINFNKPGEYTLRYTVTDSDNNTVTKERKIAIFDMKDFKYLTDYEWKSAVQSYSTTRKDKSVSDKALRLTDENGKEVVYERGIGSHANATIIYDLSDKNYSQFTSYIGVDREMYNRPGSVTFEVYVDGEKQFDSGLMLAKDPQKFIDINIVGAKELKLVVTNGGNGNASDHATWGNAKLHFVNSERADVTILAETIKKAENIEKDKYTEESVNTLQSSIDKAKETLRLEFVNQATCDEMVAQLEKAIEGLELVDKTVTIEDEVLVREIKNALNIKDRDINMDDMKGLTSLTLESGYVTSLKGLEHAVNLESLNINYNEITDISPIKNLKKLTYFSGEENFIMKDNSEVKQEDGKFILEDVIIDADGERLFPTEVVLSPRNNPIKLELNEVLVGNRVVIDSSLIDGIESIEILYESKSHNYQVYSFAFLSL